MTKVNDPRVLVGVNVTGRANAGLLRELERMKAREPVDDDERGFRDLLQWIAREYRMASYAIRHPPRDDE
jgi:hypothetical protein